MPGLKVQRCSGQRVEIRKSMDPYHAVESRGRRMRDSCREEHRAHARAEGVRGWRVADMDRLRGPHSE